MSTPNTWGNEHYHRPSQARPFYPPPPLPDDPGPVVEPPRYTARNMRIVLWYRFTLGSLFGVATAALFFLWRHTP